MKAPVKTGMEVVVKVYYVVRHSKPPRPRVMRRLPLVRERREVLARGCVGGVLSSEIMALVRRPCTLMGKTIRYVALGEVRTGARSLKTLARGMRRSSMYGNRESLEATERVPSSVRLGKVSDYNPSMYATGQSDRPIVCAGQCIDQEGLSPSGAQMRGTVSKAGVMPWWPKKEEDIGEIVATGFNNYLTLFIRHRIGDIGMRARRHKGMHSGLVIKYNCDNLEHPGLFTSEYDLATQGLTIKPATGCFSTELRKLSQPLELSNDKYIDFVRKTG